MGENFPTSEADKLRRAGKIPLPTFDTTTTISFGFHSMFLDFQEWRLVSFPLIRSMDLHLMWAKSAIRYVRMCVLVCVCVCVCVCVVCVRGRHAA